MKESRLICLDFQLFWLPPLEHDCELVVEYVLLWRHLYAVRCWCNFMWSYSHCRLLDYIFTCFIWALWCGIHFSCFIQCLWKVQVVQLPKSNVSKALKSFPRPGVPPHHQLLTHLSDEPSRSELKAQRDVTTFRLDLVYSSICSRGTQFSSFWELI